MENISNLEKKIEKDNKKSKFSLIKDLIYLGILSLPILGISSCIYSDYKFQEECKKREIERIERNNIEAENRRIEKEKSHLEKLTKIAKFEIFPIDEKQYQENVKSFLVEFCLIANADKDPNGKLTKDYLEHKIKNYLSDTKSICIDLTEKDKEFINNYWKFHDIKPPMKK